MNRTDMQQKVIEEMLKEGGWIGSTDPTTGGVAYIISLYLDEESDEDILSEAHKKAVPEGEASIIIKKERRGDYYVHSSPGTKSDAWFISKTSILNLVDEGEARITWQPESFFNFASTICTETESEEADKAFEAILLSVSESGVDLLDDETLGQAWSRYKPG